MPFFVGLVLLVLDLGYWHWGRQTDNLIWYRNVFMIKMDIGRWQIFQLMIFGPAISLYIKAALSVKCQNWICKGLTLSQVLSIGVFIMASLIGLVGGATAVH